LFDPVILKRRLSGKTLMRVLILARVSTQELVESVPVGQRGLGDRPEISGQERLAVGVSPDRKSRRGFADWNDRVALLNAQACVF